MNQRVIYKITNLLNSKIYIGKDSRNRKDYYGSGTAIKNAILKYGKSNFSKEIIDEANSLEDLNKKETEWILFYNSNNPSIGYNRSIGGEGNWDLSSMTSGELKKREEKMRSIWASKEFSETKRKNTIEYYKDPENRKKQSEIQKKFWESLDESGKNQIRERLRIGREERWKKDDAKEKASLLWKENNPMFIDSVRKKISEGRRGKDNHYAKKCEVDGVIYDSIIDACNNLGLTRNQMAYRIKSLNYKNYKKI